jgi:hypothetical protein
MTKQIPRIEVKISFAYPDVAPPPLYFEWYNSKLGKNEYLMNDGKYASGSLSESQRRNIAFIALERTEKWEHPTRKGRNRAFTKLSYVPESHESELTSMDDKRINYLKRQMHAALMKHSLVIIRDLKGNNINENALPSAQYELIDESAGIRQENEKNELVAKYSPIITDMHKNNEQQFIELCYALNVPNIHITPIEALYNKAINMLSVNPKYVDSVYNNSKLSFFAMINRAIYEPINNTKQTVIELKDGYYMFNNGAIGKTLEEVSNYFQANPPALKALEQKMGRFVERDIKKIPEQVNVKDIAPVLQTKSAISQVKIDNKKSIDIKQKLITVVGKVARRNKKGEPISPEPIEIAIKELIEVYATNGTDDENQKYKNLIENFTFQLLTNEELNQFKYIVNPSAETTEEDDSNNLSEGSGE